MEPGIDSVLLVDKPMLFACIPGPSGPSCSHSDEGTDSVTMRLFVVQVSSAKIHLDSLVLVHASPVSLTFLLGKVWPAHSPASWPSQSHLVI